MLEESEKNWVKTLVPKKFMAFSNFGDFAGFEAYYIVSGPAGLENGPKPPKIPKKVFWS